MASLDPLAGAQSVELLIDAEVQRLAADAAALRGLLSVGEVVQARVLPSNGLTDLLEILGKRVAASLPADLRPGDVIRTQVTGFDGDRILLHVLAQDDAATAPSAPPSAVFVAASIVARPPDGVAGSPTPPPIPGAALPPAEGGATPVPAAATTPLPSAAEATPAPAAAGAPAPAAAAAAPVPPSAAAPNASPTAAAPTVPPAPPPNGAAGAAPTIVPPLLRPPTPPAPPASAAAPGTSAAPEEARTIVVASPGSAAAAAAASGRAIPPLLTRTPVIDGLPAALRVPLGPRIAGPPPPAPPRAPLPGAPGTEPPRPSPPSTPIESRIAAARTGATSLGPDFAGRPAPESRAPAAVPASPPPPAARPFVAPPPIAPRGSSTPPAPPGAPAPPAAPPPPAAAPVLPRTAADFTDPAALVRALRLPVTPTNIANAKLALETPARLPAALDALERALQSSDDPRAQTLRTIAAFVGRLDPKSPALATQLASYVEHVIDGGEAKLAALVAAQTGTAASSAPAATAPSAPGPAAAPPASPVPASAAGAAPPAPAPPPPAVALTPASAAHAATQAPPVPLGVAGLAQAAERELAVAHDLKSVVLALLAAPPAGVPTGVPGALADVATAITAQQLAAATQATQQAAVLSFPIATPDGVAHAQVKVDRDAPDGGGRPIDGDDFHIAFVLETAHLGVIAIDVRTVGRSVDLAVRTETAPVAQRIGAALGDLRGRLESLRYTVASSDARAVDRPGDTVGVPARTAPDDADPNALMDRRA